MKSDIISAVASLLLSAAVPLPAAAQPPAATAGDKLIAISLMPLARLIRR